MEMENREQQAAVDPRKNKYVVNMKRDTKMMRTFVSFTNRVKHPRVTFNLFLIGAMLVALPLVNKQIALPGVIIGYAMGTLLLLMAFFRYDLSVMLMKGNPEVRENEIITYLFGNSGIRARHDKETESMGYYKDVYRVWEDERHFYIGLESEDLLILPKTGFEEGDQGTFLDFILEKSGADYRWQPAKFMNICKDKMKKLKMKMLEIGQNLPEEKNKK